MEPEWISALPTHWDHVPFGAIFSQSKRTNVALERDFVLSLVKDVGVVPYSEKGNIGNKVSDDLSKYKLVDKGDFVLNSMNLFMGSVGVSEYDGVTSTAYIVCKPKASICSGYYKYLIHSRPFQEWVGLLGKGIMEIREAVRWTALKSVRVPLPKPETQQTIAAFLDHETARVDQLIKNKRRLTELLEERRTSIIARLTTEGDSRELPTQSTGSPFFPRAPKRWALERLRFSIRKIEQGWSPVAENRPISDDEWGVLKVGCVNYGTFRPGEHKALSPVTDPRPQYEVRNGDLLMSRGNTIDLVGSAAVVENCPTHLMLSDLLYRLRLAPKRADAGFLAFVLASPALRRQIEICALGSSDTMPKISQEKIRNLQWIRPPIEEQARVANVLDHTLTPMSSAVIQIRQSIDRLQEFRSALITAAVTGQIDVAAWRTRGKTDRRIDRIEEELSQREASA